MSDLKQGNWGSLPASSLRRRAIEAGVQKCRFFSAEDAMAWAVTAYRDAVLGAHPPKGGEWIEEGVEWSGPVEFADAFLHQFQRRFWNACERSQAYRDQRQKTRDTRSDPLVFVAPQEPVLPLCSTVEAEASVSGVGNAG